MLDLRNVERTKLLDAFDGADDPKAIKRLLVALAYTDGVPVATISERYGIPEPTCYDWLNRFRDQPIEEAITDDTSPGRPPKLDDDQLSALRKDLSSPPTAVGYEVDEWTPALLQNYLEDEYDTTYSLGHVRRLIGSFEDSR